MRTFQQIVNEALDAKVKAKLEKAALPEFRMSRAEFHSIETTMTLYEQMKWDLPERLCGLKIAIID